MLTAELNRTRKIGAEYEMTVPLVGSGQGSDVQAALANVLTANGVRAISRSYCHDLVPPEFFDVAVEYDSTIQGESRWAGIRWWSVELKTRILNGYDDWEAIVPKALEICRYMGARVNASTGHHVHLAFEEIQQDPTQVRSLWNLFHRFEPVIFGIVSPSRRNSNFCKPLPPTSKLLHGANSVRNIKRVLGQFDRYYGLNLTHLFEDSPHIELRYHQGTLDLAKARHWLRFCLQMTQHAVNRNCQAAEAPIANDRKGIEKLLVTAGFKVNTKVYAKVSPELRETGKYLLRRWKQFNGNPSMKDWHDEKADASDREEEAECAA